MKRKIFLVALFVSSFVLSLPAQAEEPVFTDAQKEALGPIIRDYMVSHPEDVVAALEAYQRQQQDAEMKGFQEKLAKRRADIFDDTAPFAGNPKGDVTVVEFFDYNCGYCHKAVDDIVALLEQDKNVRVIFMDLPILSPASHDAARWALAAGKQGKYYEYHVALMKFSAPKGDEAYEKIGKDVGLDTEKLRKDADSKEVRERIEKNISLSSDVGIRGTPAFVIGDSLSPGYIGLDNLKKAVEDARKAAGVGN